MSDLEKDAQRHADDFAALVAGKHRDPFAILGPHRSGRQRLVRTLQPQARGVDLLDARDQRIASMQRVHQGGLFTAILPARLRHYRLRIDAVDGRSIDCEDAYRFPSALAADDLYLLGEGTHQRIYDVLGAHRATLSGISGTRFAAWAPNASRASVVGDFNQWDGRRHPMRLHPGNGIWEIFIPGVGDGSRYKFELLDKNGRLLPLKTDPYARYIEPPPGNAAIVYRGRYRWRDADWMKRRPLAPPLDEPLSIYEVHIGSWRRDSTGDRRPLTYRELAAELVDYVVEMGFSHIELMPVTEHPFDGSWGYQPIGLYAATQRFGSPDDLRYLIDSCHLAGIGVIVDWVAAHFPKDEHGLCRFDGTALYEHDDPRRGEHADWGTLVFNYGRREVVNYLLGSALFWIDEFHVDGLRVDAVASMLYLDYSRQEGEWLPNVHGGNEDLEAIDFLRLLNLQVHARGAATYAEESTAWRGVTRSTTEGGLGFTFKWNMGWMNDSLAYVQEDPVHRRYHHDKMTFGLVYAFNENFVLPLSHDEVVHGKGSLLGKMPGDEWQRFANLRAYLANMFCHPGKKLLFMGSELAQRREWNHDRPLDWDLLELPPHQGIQLLVKDLNRFYRTTRALFELDFEPRGFEWIDWQDADNSVLSWLRRDTAGNHVVCVTNFTPVIRREYRIGVPGRARYRERINTDARYYGGSDSGNSGHVLAEPTPAHGRPASLSLTLPPLATLILEPDDPRRTE